MPVKPPYILYIIYKFQFLCIDLNIPENIYFCQQQYIICDKRVRNYYGNHFRFFRCMLKMFKNLTSS